MFALLLQQATNAPRSGDSSILLVEGVGFALVMYFLFFRPNQMQRKRQQQMLNDLKSGDNVVTNGGIVGTITAVEGDTIVVRVKPDNLKLQFARSAVSSLVPPEGSTKKA